MAGGDLFDEVTLRGARPGDQAATADMTPTGDTSDRLSLLVISDRMIATRPLPATGEVQIGRAPTCEIVIDDASISRAHAAISLGPPLILRDLGSANGTRVRDRQLGSREAVEIAPGDILQIGNATLIVQRRAPAVNAHRIWPHDYFEARLEEECARSHREGTQFSVARFHLEPPPSAAMLPELLSGVRNADVVAEYSPKELEFLLVGTSPEHSAISVQRLTDDMKRAGVVVQSGLACFPRDGRNAYELIHRASPFPRRHDSTDAAVSAAIVADRRMSDLYRLVERIAAGNIAVLILGETGVGKEVLAARLHSMSPRASMPYLRLSCAALSESLLESELFGHEKGAFTGAHAAKPGLLETADGGTVFLDEIGELPHSVQVKLLRVLEERTVLRVGGLKPRSLDVRFIAATNRDLETEIARGHFRQDLYFRLNGATLVIPPLRERTAEIPELARAFAAQAATQLGYPTPPVLSDESRRLLAAYSWPGNIRELRNVIERAVLLCGGGVILPDQLPLEKMRAGSHRPSSPAVQLPAAAASPPAAPATGPADQERTRILAALEDCRGNQTAAARQLGIARRTLINRLERYGISGPRKRR